jgi:hypothetical protein
MLRTLIAFAPLAACPIGMAAMAGVPALVKRARRRKAGLRLAAVGAGTSAQDPK